MEIVEEIQLLGKMTAQRPTKAKRNCGYRFANEVITKFNLCTWDRNDFKTPQLPLARRWQ